MRLKWLSIAMPVKRGTRVSDDSSPAWEKRFYLDFEIEREVWNKYRLADGTLLRVRWILTGFVMEENIKKFILRIKGGETPELGLGFQCRHMHAVEPPYKMMGEPDSKTYTSKELAESIIEKDMDFETLSAKSNIYILDNGVRVKSRVSLLSVKKTDKFDGKGFPRYIIDIDSAYNIILPEPIDSEIIKIVESRSANKKEKKKILDVQ